MIVVVLVVMVVAIASAFAWGARKSRDVDEELKYLNEGRGVGRGIFGLFGKGRER